MRQAVERRLRGDVPVVSYISGGLDSTVVLGICCREAPWRADSRRSRSASTVRVPTSGPRRPRPPGARVAADDGHHGPREARLGLPRAGRCAAEGPVLDTSCAALMRLAQAVHAQGYKVALTGEGADEALAGYVWYKTQKIRDGRRTHRRPGRSPGWLAS